MSPISILLYLSIMNMSVQYYWFDLAPLSSLRICILCIPMVEVWCRGEVSWSLYALCVSLDKKLLHTLFTFSLFHFYLCFLQVQRDQIELHLEPAARQHLDLTCVKLNKNQEEFKEVTGKLAAKVETLEQQVQAKWNRQARLTADLSVKLDREMLKLREESRPFIWKICRFNELFRLAKRGIDTDLESDYLFTGPVGYQLSVSMHPNGRAGGKNTHVSVYFCVWKGKYNAILPWPFTRTVTFTLIDQ